MGTIFFKKQLLVFLVVSAIAVAHSMLLSKWEINIHNDLSHGQKLFLHCKSKDNDLGERTLSAGEKFTWDFKVNLWGTTLFWCYLRRPGYEMTFDAFWVEKKTRWLRIKCENNICNWVAVDEGLHIQFNNKTVEERIHHWKPIPTN